MHAFDRATAELCTGLARDRAAAPDRQAQRVESLSVLDDRLARVKQVGRQVTDPSLRRGR